MTQREIDQLIRDISRMAAQVGCRFIPDPRKMKAVRDA